MTHDEARLLEAGDKVRVLTVASSGDVSYIGREMEVKTTITQEYNGVEMTSIVTVDTDVSEMQWSPEYVEKVIA